MKKLSSCLFIAVSFVCRAQVADGWDELTQNRFSSARALFEHAMVLEEDPNLARIGWFLTFTGQGPTPELVDAALSIVKQDPGAVSAEFVLEWMKPLKEQFDSWVEDVSGVLMQQPAKNPEIMIQQAHLLRQWATYRGDRALYQEALDRSQFVTQWRYSELFGGYPIPDFRRTWPAERVDYWADAPLQTSRSGVMVPPNDRPGRGVLFAFSEFDNPAAQSLVFRVFSYQNIAIYVDGDRLTTFDQLEELVPNIHRLSTSLPPGRHELLVKITQTRNLNGQFSLQVTANDPVTFLTPDRPEFAVGQRRLDATPCNVGLADLVDDRADGLSAFITAFLATRDHDVERAVESLEALHDQHPDSQIIAGQLTDLYLNDVGFLPADLQFSRAFDILQALDLEHPHSLENSLRLARLAEAARATQQVLQILDRVIAGNPGYCDALEFKLQVASRQSLVEAREDVLRHLDDLGPTHRWAQRLKLKVAQADGNLEETKRILSVLSELQPWGWYGAELHEINGDFEAAAEALKVRREIFPDNDYFPYAISQAYAKMDDRTEQRNWLNATLQLNPTHRQALLDLVNLDCLAGDISSAEEKLQFYLTLEPVDADFRQILSHLQGATPFNAFRVNSEEVIEAAKARPAPEGADSELLLDQLMVRLFPDGSQMRYTHLITRVLTKEAVDRESELNLPDNLEILELRTIKPDGSVFYPENIARKSSISLSGIGVGDFIDEEHIEYLPPAYYDKDGLDASMSFIFRGIDRIYHHSELVLITPEGLDPEPEVLQRNFPNEVVRTEKDGFLTIRWLTREMQPLYPEPAMPNPNSVLPAATFTYNTTWTEVRDFFENAIRPRMAMSRKLRAHVASWADEADDQEALARLVYRRLTDEIEGNGEFYENINLVWESKTGNATLLLARCYEVLGIPCDLIFTRPAQFIASAFNTPFPEMFSYVLLRLNLDGKTVWLDANRKHLPFGYIPFIYRGSDGLTLAPEASTPMIEIPTFDDASERVETHYVMHFAPDGSVEGEGLERFHGSFAAQLEEGYATMNAVELKQTVEAGMNTNYPGASITEVTVTEDLPPGVFELVSLFTHPNLAQSGPDGLTVSQLLPENPLKHQYASLPSRQFPVQISQPHVNEAVLELHLPPDYAWDAPPNAVHLDTPFGTYELDMTVGPPNVLTLTRRYHLPAQRIKPDHYAAFQDFCSAMSAHESFTLSARRSQDP